MVKIEEGLKGVISNYRYKKTDLVFFCVFVAFLIMFFIFPLYAVLYYYNIGSENNYYGFYIFWWGILYRKIPGSLNNPYLSGENDYGYSFFLHLDNFILGEMLFFAFLFLLFGVIIYLVFFVVLIRKFGGSQVIHKKRSDKLICNILIRSGITFLYISLVLYLFSAFVFAESVSKIESLVIIDFIGNPDDWKYALFHVIIVYSLFFINVSFGGKKRLLLGFIFIILLMISFSLFIPLYLVYDTETTLNLDNSRIYTGIFLFSENIGLISFAIPAIIVLISVFIIQVNYNKIFGGSVIGNVV